MPVLRHPFLGTQHFDGVQMGSARVTFHGPKKADDVQIAGAVNQLVGDLKEGGTVAIVFRVQFLPQGAEVGQLSELLGRDVRVSVQPNLLAPDAEKGKGEDAGGEE